MHQEECKGPVAGISNVYKDQAEAQSWDRENTENLAVVGMVTGLCQ